MDSISKIFRGDRVIWMLFITLCLISIVEVYSASSMLTFRTSYWYPILKHTGFLLLGMVVVLVVHSINPKYFWILVIMLPFIWVLLIATQFMGKTINEAKRFLFGFQPSEIAKICLIACVAFILSRQKDRNSEDASFKWIWILSTLTCVLILRDNFSTAALLYCVIGVMMFIGQVPFRKFKIFIIATVAFIALLFSIILFLPETAKEIGLTRGVMWVERINNHQKKPDISKGEKIPDEVFQEVMAKIAVARGGVVGQLPGNSQQSNLLPQAYSDFIYAIIVEETGIIGGIVVLFLYVFLFIRSGTIAGRCTKLFPKYLVMGCALMLVVQAFINMAVSVGLIPVTGQPLPLVSKGGTSILTTCVFFGIILSVSRFDNPRGIKHDIIIEEEFEEEKRLANEDESFDE